MYALIDCNNFYVSCERVFQPWLNGKAGVVLSNNDGCAIARSQEAKDLGIKMGAPYFEIRELEKQGKIWWRSSNYVLYQQMMRRVTGIISEMFPEMEIYSIDECFCDVSTYSNFDLEALAINLRTQIKDFTGIPTCIGVAPTKTLAKVANRIAKKHFKELGVFVINSDLKRTKALKDTEINDVWGIGRQYATKLIKMGVNTAYDLTRLPADWIQTNMTIVGLRMWKELRGIACIDMEYERPDKKGISTARSFGGFETEIEPMEEALATYVANSALKLRDQGSVCAALQVFVQTSQFTDSDKRFSNSIVLQLPTPTNFTAELIDKAIEALHMIFRKGYRYQKVGVYLTDIRPETQVQASLFDQIDDKARGKLYKATKALDKLNAVMGKDTVRFGAMGFDRKWKMRQEYLSKRYTTRLSDVIVVKAQ